MRKSLDKHTRQENIRNNSEVMEVNRKNKKVLVKKIKKLLGEEYKVVTDEEINSGYFTALRLEKIMILFLFIIIFLMISANTFGALKLTIIERKKDIAILKARIYIEVDGIQHFTTPKQIIADFQRQHYSDIDNFRTFYVTNQILEHFTDDVADALEKVVRDEAVKENVTNIVFSVKGLGLVRPGWLNPTA